MQDGSSWLSAVDLTGGKTLNYQRVVGMNLYSSIRLTLRSEGHKNVFQLMPKAPFLNNEESFSPPNVHNQPWKPVEARGWAPRQLEGSFPQICRGEGGPRDLISTEQLSPTGMRRRRERHGHFTMHIPQFIEHLSNVIDKII